MVSAQFIDNFDDGDFTDPLWEGSISNFKIDDEGQLQLFHEGAEANNSSYLSTNVATYGETTWELDFKTLFEPSGTNFGSIFLKADQSDLSSVQNGVYAKIGGESGSVDSYSLIHINGGVETVILNSEEGLAAENPEGTLRIELNESNDWKMLLNGELLAEAEALLVNVPQDVYDEVDFQALGWKVYPDE